jgi:hypothetical protein
LTVDVPSLFLGWGRGGPGAGASWGAGATRLDGHQVIDFALDAIARAT